MREMKNSGIDWIGEIPKKWDIKRIKFTLDKHFGGVWGTNASQGEEDSICIRVSDFDYPHLSIDYNNMTIRGYDSNIIESSSIIEGDILIEKSGGGEQTPVGRSVLHTGNKAMCANFIECLRPNKSSESRFLNYWLYSSYQNGYSKRNIKQTTGIQNLDISALLSETIAIPVIDEQKKIAHYLDKKCADIDKIISAKRKTNELLKERRQSIITEAVTKGLNPNAEMKDSGIDWIGKIPKHWDVTKAKYVFQDGDGSLKTGPFGSALKGKTLDYGEYKIYNQAHLISDDFLLNRHFIFSETFESLKSYEILPGDILFTMMGTIGKCKVMPSGYPKGILDSHLLKARLNDLMIPEFFSYIYDKDNSSLGITQLKCYSNGSIMDGLNSTIIKNICLTLPSVGEQKEIVCYLDEKCKEIDELIKSNNKTIEKLQEYRKSLIYEAVTGKIEVC